MNKHIRVNGLYTMCTETCIKRANSRRWGNLLNSMANSSRHARCSTHHNIPDAKYLLYKMQHDCLNHVRRLQL